MGAFGGAFVFLAAAFAYIADATPPVARGRAFSTLDGMLLLVAAAGPLVGSAIIQVRENVGEPKIMNSIMTARVYCTDMLGTRTQSLGYVGVWAACSIVYACAAIAFTGAPPSKQPPPKARALPRAPPAAARHHHHHNSAFMSATRNLQAQPSWLSSSTPALLCRLLAQRSLRPLCVAFLLAGGGV